MEWAISKKGIPEVLVRSVMILCEGAKTRVRVDSKLSEEFEVKLGMHQGSVLSPFLFPLLVDVVTDFAREGALSELLYADNFAPMSETVEGLRDKFLKWKKAFVSNDLKVNLWKVKVMVSCGITKDGLCKSKVHPFRVCILRVNANSMLYVQYGM